MNPFAYARVSTSAAAVDAAARDTGSAYLAGGTTLIDLMQLEVLNPVSLVDVSALPLAQIQPLPGGGLRLGALARNSEVARHSAVREGFPALSEAILSGASAQIRNMATTGGNLLQRTRCYYFRDVASPCNKRVPGTGCSAVGGYNRIHAVLGTSQKCIASFPGDMPVALAALDAVVRTRRPHGGERSIPIDAFYVPYGEDPARETVLEHGELITAVDLPAAGWLARSHYLKVRDRASYEFALASAAVALDIQSGKVRQARVALGGVATKPWRALEAEKALIGSAPLAAAFAAAAEAALRGAQPQAHNGFKVELCKRTVTRALEHAAAMGSA
ncbi:MAG TPA: xanthine dehydrogenase family protein subunit M [Vicinamibacteria bacterium]|nr:xanthine dehydrogenase family protein subunit M [Vicinamibacteria bacterium]